MHKLLAFGLVLLATTASAAIPASQRDALIAFYNATGGPEWVEDSGWLGPAGTECDWAGVQCDDQQANVIELSFYGNNLRGVLPPAIGDLPALRTLLLYDNFLGGQVPDAIGRLSNLETLVLDRNEFTGPIPPAIGQLTKLKLINVDGNRFTSIPREIGNLIALEEIDFSYNELEGTIPEEIGQLTNLIHLQLVVNRLSGEIPRSIRNLTKLQTLGLVENDLSGTIPPELASLTDLVSLRLSYNTFEGTIPAELRSLRNLEQLDLGGNQLTGNIPSELAELTRLRMLWLYDNHLDGTLPAALFTMTALEELSLYNNNLSGSISPEIRNLTELTVLSLSGNHFTGTLPREIGQLTKLNTFELWNNDLTGPIPEEVGNLTALTWLDLSSNEFTGPLPSTFGNLRELRYLAVYENQLSGPIPAGLGNLAALEVLYLTSNRFTGTIPESLRNPKALITFDLGYNLLTGEIPSWIGELTNLRTIYFPGNQLTGVIPPSIGQLVNLNALYLGANRLTGSIPREIGNLSELGYLSLEDNEIGGAIPPEFWQLTELVEIRLNNMALSGTLSHDIGNLKKADVFLLNHNQLEGPIPPEVGDLESLLYFSLGANRLTGPIPREIGRLAKVIQIDLYANALRGPIPPEVTGMTSLEDSSSDFSFNALTADPATLQFVNRKQYDGDLLATQTLTPSNPRVTGVSDRSVTLEWDLIGYTNDPGGYQVTATTPAGATVSIATTPSKETSSIVVRNLDPLASYHFTVSAVTHPHDYQKNLIVSDPSPSVSATTLTRVIAPPDVVLTESTTGLIQIGGAAVNEDGFTLTNFGDTGTTVTLAKEGDFFTMEPQSFPLEGGASRRVVLRSVPQPPGSYYGYIDPDGVGVSDDLFIYPTLLSAVRPAGTVIAEALSTRVEVAGAPGLDSVGQARFRNRGTAPLSGIVLSDQPWVVPATDPITIYPNEIGTVNFTVMRSRRPPDAVGALTANLSLVYVAGTSDGASIELKGPGTGVNVTLVTVVDVPKPPVAPAQLPAFGGGELAWFAPGIASFASTTSRSFSDVSVLNAGGARSINDLRLYFTPLNGQSSVATLGAITPSQSLSLANVVTSVYGAETAVGSLQFRTLAAQSLNPGARFVSADASGTHAGDLPIFRSDRSAGAGESFYLAGLRKSATVRTDIYLQETAGGPAVTTIDLLDANGASVAPPREVALSPFGMAELRDVAPAAAATAVVRVTSGRVVGYARVADEASGDTWSIPDWSRVLRFSMAEAVRIPFVDGRAATTGGRGRRRAVTHSDTPRSRTEVSIFNPAATELRARVQMIEAGGRASARDIVLAPRQTTTMTDVGSSASSPTGSVVVIPLAGGQMVVSARSQHVTSGSHGTAIPVLPATSGLRVGQSQRFAGLTDSTAATVAAARPGTFRTSFGFVETAGRSATVRARLFLDAGRDLVSAIIYRDYVVAPGQQLIAADLVRSIIGNSRDNLGELAGLQLHLEVVSGSGAIVPFVIVTENASGDTTLRVE